MYLWEAVLCLFNRVFLPHACPTDVDEAESKGALGWYIINTQNHWVCELCPLPGILEKCEIIFRKLDGSQIPKRCNFCWENFVLTPTILILPVLRMMPNSNFNNIL
jgi:hypothetical protein